MKKLVTLAVAVVMGCVATMPVKAEVVSSLDTVSESFFSAPAAGGSSVELNGTTDAFVPSTDTETQTPVQTPVQTQTSGTVDRTYYYYYLPQQEATSSTTANTVEDKKESNVVTTSAVTLNGTASVSFDKKAPKVTAYRTTKKSFVVAIRKPVKGAGGYEIHWRFKGAKKWNKLRTAIQAKRILTNKSGVVEYKVRAYVQNGTTITSGNFSKLQRVSVK